MRTLMTTALRCAPAVLALAAGACASGQPRVSQEGASVVTQNVRGPDFDMQMDRLEVPGSRRDVVGGAADQVFALLPDIYAELGLPVTVVDSAGRGIASQNQRLRRIADQGMQNFFDCGGGLTSAANRYTVWVTTSSIVEPNGSASSTVTTEVVARAGAATQSTTVTCNSSGRLERLIGQSIRQRLGSGG